MKSRIPAIAAMLSIVGACGSPTKSDESKKLETVAYSCDNGMKIEASYDNSAADAPRVNLAINGKFFKLNNAISASGARYTSMEGMSADQAIEWWTKGEEGSLSSGPKNEDRLLKESVIIAKCKESK